MSKFRQDFLKERPSCSGKIGVERIGTLSIQRSDGSKVHWESAIARCSAVLRSLPWRWNDAGSDSNVPTIASEHAHCTVDARGQQERSRFFLERGTNSIP